MSDTLYVVIPCYNEQEVLRETAKRLREKFQKLMAAKNISEKSRIVFVNDGSKDSTWKIIRELHAQDKIFSGINLSRNRGHQNALLAGLMTVKNCADAVISMDADLQDDINAIDEMILKFKEGFDIVYGVRSKRETDTFFKRFTAESFYKLIKFLGGDIVNNHADFTTLGVAMSTISFFIILWTLYEYFFGDTVRGWTSMLASLWFIGGLILLSVGIVGEYVGKIYLETKRRPRFIVSEFLNDSEAI